MTLTSTRCLLGTFRLVSGELSLESNRSGNVVAWSWRRRVAGAHERMVRCAEFSPTNPELTTPSPTPLITEKRHLSIRKRRNIHQETTGALRVTAGLEKVEGPGRLRGFGSPEYPSRRSQPGGERRLPPNRQVKHRVAENTERDAYYYTATMRHWSTVGLTALRLRLTYETAGLERKWWLARGRIRAGYTSGGNWGFHLNDGSNRGRGQDDWLGGKSLSLSVPASPDPSDETSHGRGGIEGTVVRGRMEGAYGSRTKTVEQVWEKGCRKKSCWNSRHSRTRGKGLGNGATRRPMAFTTTKHIQHSTNQGTKESRRRFDGREVAVHFMVYGTMKSSRLQRQAE